VKWDLKEGWDLVLWIPIGIVTFTHRVIGNDRKLYQEIDLFQLYFRNSSLPFIFRIDGRNTTVFLQISQKMLMETFWRDMMVVWAKYRDAVMMNS
jgi:hypothetical protein